MLLRDVFSRFLGCERGSIAIFLVIILPLLLVIGGVATDITLLNAQKKAVQSQADLAAQSAVNHLVIPSEMRETARTVVSMNDTYDAPLLLDSLVEIGVFNRSTGFVASPEADQNQYVGQNAVKVTVRSPFKPMLLHAILSDRDLVIERSAIASLQGTVVFSLRNRLLKVDTTKSVLADLLGDALNLQLTAVEYNALLGLDITAKQLLGLVDLSTGVGALTMDKALTTSVDASKILALVLPRSAVSKANASGVKVKIGDFLKMSNGLLQLGINELPDVSLNALDVLAAVAQLSGEQRLPSDHRYGVEGSIRIPQLVSANPTVGLLHRPVMVVASFNDLSPPMAELAQVEIGLDTHVNALVAQVGLNTRVGIGAAQATLTNLYCGAVDDDSLAEFSAQTGVATIRLGVTLKLLGANLLPPPPDETSFVAGSGDTVSFSRNQVLAAGPDGASQKIDNVISLTGTIDPLTKIISNMIPALGPLLGGVTSLLRGLLSTLSLDLIVDHLLRQLGIDEAQADLIVHSFNCQGRLVQ